MDFKSNKGDKGNLSFNQNKKYYQNFTRPKVSKQKATEMVCNIVEKGVNHDQVHQGIKWISNTYENAYTKESAINSLKLFANALDQFDRPNLEGKKDRNKILESLENAQKILTKDAIDNEAIRLVLLELAKPTPVWLQESPAIFLQQLPEKDESSANELEITQHSQNIEVDHTQGMINLTNQEEQTKLDRIKNMPESILTHIRRVADTARDMQRTANSERKAFLEDLEKASRIVQIFHILDKSDFRASSRTRLIKKWGTPKPNEAITSLNDLITKLDSNPSYFNQNINNDGSKQGNENKKFLNEITDYFKH